MGLFEQAGGSWKLGMRLRVLRAVAARHGVDLSAASSGAAAVSERYDSGLGVMSHLDSAVGPSSQTCTSSVFEASGIPIFHRIHDV